MSVEDPQGPLVGDRVCPEAERLAEYVDNVFGPADRRKIEAHLVTCAECRAVIAEVTAFRDADLGGDAWGRPSTRVRPIRWGRWASGLAAGLTAASALTFVIRVMRPNGSFVPRTDRPELTELVAALASEPARSVEGRLTGGFRYAPAPSPTRGRDDRDVSPDVKIAAAKIEKLAREHDMPGRQGALGVAYLAVGDFEKAIDALEYAVLQDSGNAFLQSDLSAAYLARAKWRDRPDDWPKALAAAERAITADPRLAEAYFNRALALEGLHLDASAADAWSAYRRLDPSGPWAADAARHEQDARSRARPTSSLRATPGNQELRERIEDDLLTKWGEAVIGGDRIAADHILDEASFAARALVAAGGDSMARDEITAIRSASSNSRRRDALASGHRLYGLARREFLADKLRVASETMNLAGAELARAGSVYASWPPIYRAIVSWTSQSPRAALDELATVSTRNQPPTYLNLRGRYDWTAGAALALSGRVDLAREYLRSAVDAYKRGSEWENLSINETGLAETEWVLGEPRAMWEHELDALSRLALLSNTTRRNALLIEGGIFSLSERLPEAALHFENTLVALIGRSPAGAGQADVFMRRARILGQLGQVNAAVEDLGVAERALAEVQDERVRGRARAELERVRADVLLPVAPAQALAAVNSTLEYFAGSGFASRTAEVLTVRARTHERLGHAREARADLRAAIDAYDQLRQGLARPQDRMQAFQRQREAYADLVGFEIMADHNVEEGLRIAERGRARTLLDNINGPGGTTVDPTKTREALPADTVVVYYSTLIDRLSIWVLTRERSAYLTLDISSAKLQIQISRLHHAIRQHASFRSVLPYASPLFEELVAPVIRLAADKSRIVFVPDAPLSLIPFAMLPDSRGLPLIRTYIVGAAPSMTVLLAASRQLEGFSAKSVLAVGDGHDPRRSGLPRLRSANDEAGHIAALYPESTVLSGLDATPTRFLSSSREVIHFAGHTITDPEFPMLSRLLLAPEANGRDNGDVSALAISEQRFERTKVIVLASCDGAAGKLVDGEGVISVARMFLSAGIPSVIASLWPVDDTSQPLFVRFHQELRKQRDPLRALRSSQLAFFDAAGVESPVRDWGGFLGLGGLTSIKQSKD